jgi:hypothetical protein
LDDVSSAHVPERTIGAALASAIARNADREKAGGLGFGLATSGAKILFVKRETTGSGKIQKRLLLGGIERSAAG